MHLDPPAISTALTPKQALALPHLACASSMAEGAIRAHIDRSTLRRWMHDDHFRAQLQHMRDEASSLAKAKLEALMLKSVMVLDDSLEAADEALRLRAARIIVNAALRSEESRDLRHRLDVLDDALIMVKRAR